MIDDNEMRDLFSTESGEHLQRINDCLLSLEKDPSDVNVLEEIFREIHSLKGAARMIGLTDIEEVSHGIEDILGAARKGELIINKNVSDTIYRALDATRLLVREAVTGEPAGVSNREVMDFLKHEMMIKSDSASGPEGAAGNQAATDALPVSEIPIDQFRIDTIRVDTKKLDSLMTYVGELAVTQLRISRRPAEINNLEDLFDELMRRFSEEWRGTGRVAVLGAAALRDHRQSTAITPGLNGETSAVFSEISNLIKKIKSAMHEDNARLEFAAGGLEEGVRSMRLLPLSTIFQLYPRMVRDLAGEQSKDVELVIRGGEITADKRILEEMKDPIMHLVRNAVDHGLETPGEREKAGKNRAGTITIKTSQTAANILLEIADDGRGIDLERVKRTALKRKLFNAEELDSMNASQVYSILFISGFSTSSFVSDVSGRGVGLDVVRNTVERLKGSIQIESEPGAGSLVRIVLPQTLATTRVLVISVNGFMYALAIEYVNTLLFVNRKDIFTIEGRSSILFNGRTLSVARLSDLLELRNAAVPDVNRESMEKIPCIVVTLGEESCGLLVDDLLDEHEIVIKQKGRMLNSVGVISGITILGEGDLCVVLNPYDLIEAFSRQGAARPAADRESQERKKAVLMAEDSITTRTQIKRILERAGYEVETAVDGADAYTKLGSRAYDALVSDILMPNMTGLDLAAKIRQDKQYQDMPIILVTSLASDEDRRRGLEAGANAYITKPAFDQKLFLDTLKRLV
jgi:two-component system, chemotaxis family, sensor kinase CheA